MIRITPIRVIGPDNEQIGVVDTRDAIAMAEEAGLDLVEVVSDSRPPICKIMDYGKYKYELSKRDTKQTNKGNEIKEIRLGRSVKIGVHDVQIRVDQARRFNIAGHKVQIAQRFRGREMQHKQLGIERLAQVCEDLSDVAKVDMAPRWSGREASIVLSPDRAKVDAYKRAHGLDDKSKAEQLKRDTEAAERALAEADARDAESDDNEEEEQAKHKGSKDDRQGLNPVDSEIESLLGGGG